MQANGLVVANVSETLGTRRVPHQQLWVEAPSNDRSSNHVVLTVEVDPSRNIKELLVPTATAAGSEAQARQSAPLLFGKREEARVCERYEELALEVFDVGERLLAEEVLAAKLELVA
jgi:hypothetical protein